MQRQAEPGSKQQPNWHSKIAKLKNEGRLRGGATAILILSWAGVYSINYQDFNSKPSLLPCLLLALSLIIFLVCQIKARGSKD